MTVFTLNLATFYWQIGSCIAQGMFHQIKKKKKELQAFQFGFNFVGIFNYFSFSCF